MLSALSGMTLLVSIMYLIASFLNKELRFKTAITIARVVLVLSLFGLFSPFQVVPASSKGLLFTFGNLNNKVLDPGLNLRVPFIQDIKCITVRPIQLECDIPVGPAGAQTQDNQTIGSKIMIFYRYKAELLPVMWTKYGEDRLQSLIIQSTIESFKAIVGNHNIFDIPLNQDKIRTNTVTALRSKLTEYPIELTELKITNYDWSDEFDKQIQETMHRAQQVKQKEQELLITEQEAQKKVKTAEADKQALITTAEGEKAAAILMAEAKAAEGEGIKKYNQAVQANMELELKIRQLEIERIRAEKWNGQYVPVNNYGPIPISSNSGVLPK